MKITVFCSANEHIDPDYFRMTEELGRWMAENHHNLIFGGTNHGLMNCIAKAVHDGGGRVIGVVPSLRPQEPADRPMRRCCGTSWWCRFAGRDILRGSLKVHRLPLQESYPLQHEGILELARSSYGRPRPKGNDSRRLAQYD